MLKLLFDNNFPDPSAYYDGENIFLYATNEIGNLQVRRSSSWNGPWEDLGCLLTVADFELTPGIFWAPSPPVLIDDEFRIYYTCRVGEDRLGINLAKSSGPLGFVSSPQPIMSGQGYAVIDPHVIEYQGHHWLFWGSMHQPIQCQRLLRDGTLDHRSEPIVVLEPNDDGFTRLIEGFFVYEHDGVWHAFVSGNNTWELDDYAITCYVAETPFGPFLNPKTLLAPTDTWGAPGQNSMVVIDQIHYLVCHAVQPGVEEFKRVPCVAIFDPVRRTLSAA